MTTIQGWKAVKPDLTTRHGFKWWPGTTVQSDHNLNPDNTGVCPTREGDGLCIARTWAGAASAGFPTSTCVIVEYEPDQVLAEDPDKLRVKGPIRVVDVYDAQALLRQGFGISADLHGADLRSADLRYSNLRYANLHGANLRYSNLRSADLRYSNLRYADLHGADLHGADLRSADLRYSNLRYADLRSADLRYSNLRSADLHGALLPESGTVDA